MLPVGAQLKCSWCHPTQARKQEAEVAGRLLRGEHRARRSPVLLEVQVRAVSRYGRAQREGGSVCGRLRWRRPHGLVVRLPHGCHGAEDQQLRERLLVLVPLVLLVARPPPGA